MKLFVLLALVVANVGAFRYDGYRLLKIAALHDSERVKGIVALTDDDDQVRQVILMNEHVSESQPIDLAVAPQAFSRVAKYLNRNQISFKITKNDLQKSFDEMMQANELALSKWRRAASSGAPTAYLSHAEQVAWLENAVAQSSIATTFKVGKSYEGRDLIGIKINGDKADLPSIWLDANIHAREWISSATALYIIDQILNGQSVDAVRMRTNYRWYILPNANPDGYEFSRSTNRLWRKTRSRYNGNLCIGADPNRNWDIAFGSGVGTSNNPCSDIYPGVSAFSEIETRSIANYVSSISSTTNVFITIHAYSQLWLLPWSAYTYKPDDFNELLRVGKLAAEAIESVNGLKFTVGTPPDILYPAAGSSFDYAKAKLNIAYVCGPELRPASDADGGFVIEPSNIAPSGEETFAGVVAFVTNAKHKL